MATGRKTVVVGQVLDPNAWGNPLWDQSVQTFTSAAQRTAQFPAPLQGAVTYLEDVKRWQGWDGTTWRTLDPPPYIVAGAPIVGAAYTGQQVRHIINNQNIATDAAGDIVLMVAADYAGGGVLHASVHGRSTVPIVAAVRVNGANLVARIFNPTNPVLSTAVALTVDITYFTA